VLGEIEEPIHTILPQITRTVKLADEMSGLLAGPVEQMAPGLAQLANTLNSPIVTTFPAQLGTLVDAINDLVKRLSPLGQIAESAGGLFGLRLPGMPRPAAAGAAGAAGPLPDQTGTAAGAAPAAPPPARTKAAPTPTAKKVPVKRSAATKRSSPSKRSPADKRSPAAKRSGR
jgi:hypothetical protein